MKTVSDIRAAFLAYFNQHDHTVVPSSSLVPHNDPTLLFTNAGMVQFKNAFTGAETLPYVRAASSQKCVRAGGKHNDLENVGHTARHHTFFEMLGNFSFGDYFKEDAIKLAWDLITKEFGLSAEKLLVTVYADDEEAAGYWKKIAGFPDHKIIRIATSDNFWSMGPTGPCGPCSEIFYDHGESIPGGPPGSPNEDGDRFIEIWNLVFMQYEQIDEKTRINLPKPSIDTGMGLERIAAVLQGKHDNYDIDLFKNLIKASTDITGHKGSVSHRVIADHLRSSCFLMADGVMPSNEGRGYVLRRIMRRAMRHVHILGYDDCLMHQLVPALIAEMGQAYSELIRAQAFMTETLKIEEERFKRTLGNGLRLLQEEESKLSPGQNLPGDVAFKLYDTFGFPLDLTQDVLKASDRSVDLTGFDQCMEKQRTDARANWVGSGEKTDDQVWFDLRQQFGATEFLGYDSEEAEGKVLAIVQKGQSVEELSQGQEAQLLINQTPFYAESGGQTGDAGTIKTKEAHLQVRDVKKLLGDLHVHHVTVEKGTLCVGEIVQSKVDHERRLGLRAHHSATHLLHKALRDLLGDQVIQKGSLVGADRLRFDFSFPKSVSKSDLQKIEDEVNRVIRSNAVTHTHLMNVAEAIEKGAMALFGEKYADEVRVVSMGSDTDGDVYSVELCGGTHVHRAGDIGYFRIVSESGIAAGIRRIEAFAGRAAEEYVRSRETVLEATAELLKARPVEVLSRVEALQEERKKLEKEIQKLRQSGGGGSAHQLKEIKGITLAYQILEETSPKDLKPIADALKSKIKSGIIVVIGKMEDKVSLVVCVTEDLISTFNAVDLARAGSEILGGQGGGGRPDMAQAGGIYPDKAEDVISKIEEVITAQI